MLWTGQKSGGGKRECLGGKQLGKSRRKPRDLIGIMGAGKYTAHLEIS